MKAVRVHGPDDVRLDEIEAPVAGPKDVIVRVATAGICGSDVTYVHAGGVAAADRRHDRDADAGEEPGHAEALKPWASSQSVIAVVQPVWS